MRNAIGLGSLLCLAILVALALAPFADLDAGASSNLADADDVIMSSVLAYPSLRALLLELPASPQLAAAGLALSQIPHPPTS